MIEAVINVAVIGASGRMGKTLIEMIHARADMQLTAAIERKDSPYIALDAGELAGLGNMGVAVTDDLASVIDQFDVLIDFTIPEASAENIEICAAAAKKIVIGTTGLSEVQESRLKVLSSQTAIVYAPNFSVGVNATFKLLEVAAQIFGDDVDIEVIESHHRHKLDAPSGTALKMGQVVADVLGRDLNQVASHGRSGIGAERARETIGFSAIRAGDIIGEHTVMFAGAGERVEITHRAHSRTNFAQGAIRAVLWLSNHSAGLYDMQDVLGLGSIAVLNKID